MNRGDAAVPCRSGRLLTFRSGGWVLLVAGLMCLAVVARWVMGVYAERGVAVRGDGRHVESYGFDLSTCLAPRELIAAAGFPKDGIPALTSPEVFTRVQAAEFDRELQRGHQGKYLVPSDRVIGVETGGAARAYPLRIVSWHEVVNDTLGGRPIVVTYSPLCDSTVVFDRRVGDETLEFGVSGLVYNSNLLMYDRRPAGAGESVWSQLQFRAVAGPAAVAGRKLTIVPAVVVHWSDWQAAHPQTTILAPDRSRMEVYKRSYGAYFASEKLHFPVVPLPPKDTWPLKTPIVAVRTTGDWHVFSLPDIGARTGGSMGSETEIDGVEVRLDWRDAPSAVWPRTGDGGPVEVVYSFWFAWHAMTAGGTNGPR